MKSLFSYFFVTLAALTFVFPVLAQTTSTDKLAVVPLALTKERDVQYFVQIYPTEIYYGDPVYVVVVAGNTSNETVSDVLRWLEPRNLTFTVSSERYELTPEYTYSANIFLDYSYSYHSLAPQTSRVVCKYCVELPALDESEAAFWQSFALKLNESGYVGRLSVEVRGSELRREVKTQRMRTQRWGETVEQDILVKPRPKNETEILRSWFRETPSELWPVSVAARMGKFSREWQLESSGQSDIEIDGNSYDPWLFVRVGNRKPSDPNNPTTVDGWRKLEAEFAPSTLRDEITLTRLQLEYYDAAKGEASDAALKILVDWLSQRPEPQRVVLSQSLLSKRAKFKGTPLEAKNATLCDALTSAFPVETPTTDDAK